MYDHINRLEQRILALEDIVLTPNKDNKESMDVLKESCICFDNKQLLEANAILHAKVAALRMENQRLADICEEQDVVIDDLKQAGGRLVAAVSAHLSRND